MRLGNGSPVDRNRVVAEKVGRQCPAKIGQRRLNQGVVVEMSVQRHANAARVSTHDRIEQPQLVAELCVQCFFRSGGPLRHLKHGGVAVTPFGQNLGRDIKDVSPTRYSTWISTF